MDDVIIRLDAGITPP